MRTIWKYELDIKDTLVINMPNGAKVLHVGTQQGEPCIWVEVDTEAEQVPYTFHIYGTGHPIKENKYNKPMYLGTFKIKNDSLIFHLYY